jgi:hypothetical protein
MVASIVDGEHPVSVACQMGNSGNRDDISAMTSPDPYCMSWTHRLAEGTATHKKRSAFPPAEEIHRIDDFDAGNQVLSPQGTLGNSYETIRVDCQGASQMESVLIAKALGL